MNKVIIPAGYMGSGSSAITDLISEYKGYEAANGSFEYIFLHCPNGLFDLEDKLLKGNNALRSDEALHTFRNEMYELYNRKFWWPANYKRVIGEDFIKYTDEYIESLITFKSDFYWYYQEKLNFSRFVKMVLRKILLVATGGRVVLKKPLTHDIMWLSMITAEEFYSKSKEYLNNIFNMIGLSEKHLILDQLLLPFNQHRLDNYFDGNAEMFIVTRDPRDVFISNKYVWTGKGAGFDPVPYPTDVHEFCKMYKEIRAMGQPIRSKHVHTFIFEDLIYKYDESVKRVEDILGLTGSDHTYFREKFNPDVSIKNTQLFRKEEYKHEVSIIENELSDYLYDFPYEMESEIGAAF